jgi:hypothetical protein
MLDKHAPHRLTGLLRQQDGAGVSADLDPLRGPARPTELELHCTVRAVCTHSDRSAAEDRPRARPLVALWELQNGR